MYSPPTKDTGPWAVGLSRWCAVHLLVAVIVAMPALPAKAATQRAIILEISDAIGPAIADYIVGELRAADTTQTGLIVLRMNTPGGLDSSMREIVSAILASPVPVATYVAPNGARAASAGTYIAYASAVVGMAPWHEYWRGHTGTAGSVSLLPGGEARTTPRTKKWPGEGNRGGADGY